MRFELHEDTWNSVTDGLYFEDYFNGHYIRTNKQINYYEDILAFDIETSSFKEQPEEVFERDTEVYSYLLGTKIRITDSFYKEFPCFNDIRRSLFGRIYFSKSDGITIDSLYHDLNNMFPYYFPEDIYNPYDELEKVLEVFFDNAPDNEDFDDKRSVMYVWQFAINGRVIIGRNWEEFVDLLNEISEHYQLDHNQRMIVWVHNLAWEMSFFKDLFTWDRVFAIAPRKPIYALTTTGIEFRCSYILSNLSLANVGKSLTKYQVKKLEGELDYDLIRHNETPLTYEKELHYCINDVLVVSAYIKEQCEKEGNITKLPLTATGYCRNFVRKNCLRGSINKEKKKQFEHYHKLMTNCQITSVNEYQLMVRAFAGGFTHCSTRYSGLILTDVDSFDFTSSYPYVLCSEKFPMSRGTKVEVNTYKELNEYCHYYCCIFDVKFINIKPKYINENYISTSKCYRCVNPVTNNGRLVGADMIQLSITNVDYEIIYKTYEWEAIEIGDFYIYKKDYLPKEIIMSILKLYNDKTKLKGVKGQEDFYTKGKQLLNSIYGMMVTSIIMPIHTYNGQEWTVEHKDMEKELKSYNKSKKRFLFYPWGIFCTAYARRNLWTGILSFGDDYIYSDTDSIKAVHAERHINYINSYNRLVERKLKLTAAHFKLDFELFAPKTIKGEVKMLGVWDCETEKGKWKMFKSLGAKRYMVLESDDNLTITVSGVNKKAAVPYLLDKYGKEGSFDAFNEDLVIPADYTGKLTHYYIDEPTSGYVTDYLGNTVKYESKSGVYLEKASYNFSMEAAYLDYLRSVRGELI